MEELGAAVENGFAKAMWCGERACEDEIKEKFNVSSRNMPFDQEKEWFGDNCVCCGKKGEEGYVFRESVLIFPANCLKFSRKARINHLQTGKNLIQ